MLTDMLSLCRYPLCYGRFFVIGIGINYDTVSTLVGTTFVGRYPHVLGRLRCMIGRKTALDMCSIVGFVFVRGGWSGIEGVFHSSFANPHPLNRPQIC